MKIVFRKYQGTGNDFIIIDNRNSKFKFSKQQISNWCNRRFGIGADGLMLIDKDMHADFKMTYYNSDGRESTMCGNGGRCIVKCVFDLGLKKTNFIFNAVDGTHVAKVVKDEVLLSMNDVLKVKLKKDDFELNTGSPHYVAFKKNINDFDLIPFAKKIRYSNLYVANNGINVNVVESLKANILNVRTYERGVEDETFSCGTGVVASALAFSMQQKFKDSSHKIKLITRGGNLEVFFKKTQNTFKEVILKGKAVFVFEGILS